MSVHHTRRRGPLPQDVEFACLDGASAGWSQVERDLAHQAQRGNNVKGKGKEGYVEIVPSVRMPVIEGLDGVSSCRSAQWGHGSPRLHPYQELRLIVEACVVHSHPHSRSDT